MSDRNYYILGASIGGAIGGWIPDLFHANLLSPWGIIGSIVGGIAGIWMMYRFVINP